jgi:hypothetical protein
MDDGWWHWVGLMFFGVDFCEYRYYRYNKYHRWCATCHQKLRPCLCRRLERRPRVRISLSGIVFVARYLALLFWFGCVLGLFRRAPRKPGRRTIVFLEMP